MSVMCEVCQEDQAVLVLGMSCRPRAVCGLCGPLLAPGRVPAAVLGVAA